MYHPTGTHSMIILTDVICCSVGAHVRDAAAYVCWAFARAYTAADVLESIAVLAPALLVTACYDREVSLGDVSATQCTSVLSSAAAAAAATSTIRHLHVHLASMVPAGQICCHGQSCLALLTDCCLANHTSTKFIWQSVCSDVPHCTLHKQVHKEAWYNALLGLFTK